MKSRILFLLALAPSLLVGCSSSNELKCDLKVEEIEKSFEFHTEKQLQYLEAESLDTMPDDVAGTLDQSKPKPASFKFKAEGKSLPNDLHYVLKISEYSNLKDPLIYSTTEEQIDVTNLKIDTEYFYQISACGNGKVKESEIYSFETTDTFIRNIDINGVANCRDVGGFMGEDGVRSQQGLVYRTGRLNVSASDSDIYPKPNKDVYLDITPDGMYTMLHELNVKSEIDVRKTSDNETGFIIESPLGSDVNYYNIPMEWNISSSQNILDYNKAKVVEFFEVLGDENNYPLFFHCDIGTDRTGLFSILMHGLLGDDMDEIHKDYLFSNFGMIKASRQWSKTNPYMTKLNASSGETFQEKTRNYLVDTIGVNEDDIDTFVRIMKDGLDIESRNNSYIKVNCKKTDYLPGDSINLSYVLESNINIKDYSVEISSTNEEVLKVDANGKVDFINPGSASVKFINKEADISKEIEFEVYNPDDIKKFEYKFEGEEATLGGSSSKPSVKTKYEGNEEFGTDGILVGIPEGASNAYLEFNINSEKEQEVTLALRVSVFSRGRAFYNKCVKNIVVNGETYTMDATPITVDDEVKYSTMPWYNWGFIYVEGVLLSSGENVIRINIASSPKTNFDYLAIDAENEVSLS